MHHPLKVAATPTFNLGSLAAAGSARLEEEHLAAVAAEEQARRRVIYDAAAAKVGAPSAHAAAYDMAVSALLSTLRDMAEAQFAAAAANAALPDGAVPLAIPEYAAALTPDQPRMAEETVDLWFHESTWTPVHQRIPIFVDENDPRRGYVGNQPVEMRTFTRPPHAGPNVQGRGPTDAFGNALSSDPR